MTFVCSGVGSGEKGNVVGVQYVSLRLLDLVLVGLGFLTGSDVEVEVVCASFAGGVFLESPELFRALDQPCSVQRLSCHTPSRRALHVVLSIWVGGLQRDHGVRS